MKKYFLYSLLLSGVFVTCNQNKQQSAAIGGNVRIKQSSNDTLNVYNAYLGVKDNLVKSDAKAAQQAAGELIKPLSGIKGCNEAVDLSNKIAATTDIKSQRLLFMRLTQDIIPLVKGIKRKKSPVYVAYCPMYNEGNGGYWLSANKEIKNPYYGSEMLECGEVTEEIK